MKYFIITFIISLICNTHLICQDRLPFSIKIIKDSREIIMVQDKPWEEQMIGYYKVLKTNKKKWQMWYSAWDNNRQSDYSNYLTYAHSIDGKNWIKSIPGKNNNILKGSGHPQVDGIVEQDVIIDKSSILT